MRQQKHTQKGQSYSVNSIFRLFREPAPLQASDQVYSRWCQVQYYINVHSNTASLVSSGQNMAYSCQK